MKPIRHILLSILLLCHLSGMADVVFKFSAGTIDAGALKTRMESNISALLTEIDRAGKSGGSLDLSSINMEPGAKERLTALWREAAHFVCDKGTNISKCLEDFQGYQVRGIPITMKPVDSSYTQSLNRELTVSLNPRGVITGVRLACELQEDVKKILFNPGGVADTRQRREILKWVEDFRCYYNERNIGALDQIYSDDALIITGSVVQRRKTQGDLGVRMEQSGRYKVQSKTEYINNLTKLFKRVRSLNVEFDHISVVRHPAKANIYGVTLHQKWQSNSYSDDGWLFLLWDFNDPEMPQIHVRTWQQEQIAAEDGVFTLDDFFIP